MKRPLQNPKINNLTKGLFKLSIADNDYKNYNGDKNLLTKCCICDKYCVCRDFGCTFEHTSHHFINHKPINDW